MRARKQELSAARAFVDNLPQPRLVIPGNHDTPGLNQPFDRFFRPFHRYRKYFGNDLEPEYRCENFHLVSLNSSKPFGLYTDWSVGILTEKQLLKCASQFDEIKAHQFRIIVLHHPLLPVPDHRRILVKPLSRLLEVIDHAKVDLVLCGHFHRSQLATVGLADRWNCVVSQAPTVCSTRLKGEDQGFHEIRLGVTQIEVVLWRFVSDQFLPVSTTQFRCGEHGWGIH